MGNSLASLNIALTDSAIFEVNTSYLKYKNSKISKIKIQTIADF